MSAHGITLVIGEAVAGITRVERSHQRIARDLCENGSNRDAGGFGVALIIACCGIAISFKRFASIRKCCGVN
jgi:hypothetical protein